MRKVTDLTGPGYTDQYGVGGTDLGVCALAPDGRLVAIFGDTFDEATVGGPGWRSPVVLFGDSSAIRSGIRWTGSLGPRSRYADQALDYRHEARLHGHRVSTILPTDVITLGNRMFLHVMVCKGLGNVLWTEIFASDDNGETWQPTGATWPGDAHGGLFQMLTWEVGSDGYVYVFSTGFQRDKGLILQRVPADRLTDVHAWEGWGFRDGRWGWGNPPTIALTGAYGELCLRVIEGRWLLALFDAGNYRIDVLNLDSPTANLYESIRGTVLFGSAWDREDHERGHVAQLYGGYIVPGSTLDELHLVVSQWNTHRNWPYRSMQFTGPAPRPGMPEQGAPPPPAPEKSKLEQGMDALNAARDVIRRFRR